MLRIKNKQLIYNFDFCQQCGICQSVCPKGAISFSLRKDGLKDVLINPELCIKCGKCVRNCPSNVENDYENYFEQFKYKKFFLGYNIDSTIRRNCSSGGVCKTLIIESIKKGIVDGVYSLQKTDSFPFAKGEFYTIHNIPTYESLPNSIYHSVMSCTEISKITSCKSIMIVGTACQLRALNTYLNSKFEKIVSVCIFCKQQKTIDSTRFITKIMGTKLPDDLNFTFTYRGSGWPGIVKINDSELPYSRASQIPFGKRLWTVPGCDICGDSYGMKANADITLMDPWGLGIKSNLGVTLVTIHTTTGLEIIKTCENLSLTPKNYADIKPALSLKDVWRKQVTESVLRGKSKAYKYIFAVKLEFFQRKILRFIVDKSPRLPIICYRIIAKFPDLRNLILK